MSFITSIAEGSIFSPLLFVQMKDPSTTSFKEPVALMVKITSESFVPFFVILVKVSVQTGFAGVIEIVLDGTWFEDSA